MTALLGFANAAVPYQVCEGSLTDLLATILAWRASRKRKDLAFARSFGLWKQFLRSRLLGCHLFGFAFLAHEFQFALGGFDLCRNLLLNASCRFFELG